MNRPLWLVASLVPVCVLLSSNARAQDASNKPAARPNIVYILADDMGYGDVSCMNSRSAWRTTHMDRLAGQGMAFTDAHSGSGVCTPTRYGVITGRYSWRSRLKRGVLGGASQHLIDPARMTVASYLKEHGYHTACIGKWHLGMDFGKSGKNIDFSKPVTFGPSANGFDYYYCHNGSLDMAPYVYVENGKVTAAPNRSTQNKDYQGFWRKGKTGSDFEHEDVLPNFTRRAVDHIARRAATKEPFFLYLALPAPHTPILPTEEFRGKSKTNPYGDFVLQVDDTVGQVMKALDKAGVADNTLLIVTADNGCSPRARFEELEKFGHDPSHVFRGHKADIYEGGHHVPFLARWPGVVKAGGQSEATICLTDLLRTCSEIVGTPLPDTAGEDSVSFLPALRGEPGQVREATVHHSINGSFAIRAGKWKLCLCPGSGGWSKPRPPAAFKSGGPLLQLFDLDQDIGETTNLVDKHPEVVDRLLDLLRQYVREGRSTPGQAQENEGKTPYLPKGYKSPDPLAGEARPNIILAFIDDMGWGDFSCFGNQAVETQNIDRLAAEGVRFEQFYVNSPICSPSRVAISTGQYPQRWRITSYLDNRKRNIARGMAQWLDPKAPMLARMLNDAGYATGHFGKWHMGGQRDVGDAPLITEYGFEASLTNFEGLGPRVLALKDSYDGKPTRVHALGSHKLGRGKISHVDRSKVTESFTSAALKFIQRAERQKRPFYVNLWPDDVHSPFFPPKARRGDSSKRQLYHGVLDTMDEQLGVLFDYVRGNKALRDNTLILVCSDNGPEPGAGSAGGLRGFKTMLYEGGIRSSLVVWGPGFISRKSRGLTNSESVFCAMDLVPSLLAIAGISPAKGVEFDGESLPEVLLGSSRASRQQPVFFRRPPDRDAFYGVENLPDLCVRQGQWKLLCEYSGAGAQLYDLSQDPGETRDLSGSQPALVGRLSKLLCTWHAEMPEDLGASYRRKRRGR